MDAIVDISNKPKVRRESIATGLLILNKKSIDKIRKGEIKKGNVQEASTIAAIQAIKETSRIIPHCHNIPIEASNVNWKIEENGLRCTVSVISNWNTGVEMEALCGVSNGLLCALDMLKSVEKDSNGQYPNTLITDIRIVKKIKEQPYD
jgi:cyclic pyranopterin phosphate synthase